MPSQRLSAQRISAAGQDYVLREARAADLGQIIALLADDELRRAEFPGAERDREHYLAAFEEIDADPAHALVVVESAPDRVVATMQLSTLPGLSRRGAKRLQIEAVRVASALRGAGLGSEMIRWALAEAERKKIPLIQLTSDAQRKEAHRFYERLGFTASHTGFKMHLEQ